MSNDAQLPSATGRRANLAYYLSLSAVVLVTLCFWFNGLAANKTNGGINVARKAGRWPANRAAPPFAQFSSRRGDGYTLSSRGTGYGR
jgi:hypothetical protein